MAILPLTNLAIADVLKVPCHNVDLYWPLIETCLDALGCGSINSKVGALATIAVETAGRFEPLHEYAPHDIHSAAERDAYFEDKYGGRKDLGNIHVGDGAKYEGRGFIQITGELNYKEYGTKLAVDMVSNPEIACEPHAASAIFAAYWHDRKCDVYADVNMWEQVRKKVNGGTNGLPLFLRYVNGLLETIHEANS